MWISVVCTLIDNDTCHHSGQNDVDSQGAAKWILITVMMHIQVTKSTDHAEPHLICFFFYNNITVNERNLCQDLLTIENTNLDLKVQELHYRTEILVRIRLSFQKLLQTRSTCIHVNNKKKMFEKRVDVYWVVDRSTDHDKPHFDLLFTTKSTSKKMFFFQSTCWKRHCVTHCREQHGKLANQTDGLAAVVVKNTYSPGNVKFFCLLWLSP